MIKIEPFFKKKQGNQDYFYKAYIIITLNQYLKRPSQGSLLHTRLKWLRCLSLHLLFLLQHQQLLQKNLFLEKTQVQEYKYTGANNHKMQYYYKNIRTYKTYIFDCINPQRKKKKKKQQTLQRIPFLEREKSLKACPNVVDSLENCTESLTNLSSTTENKANCQNEKNEDIQTYTISYQNKSIQIYERQMNCTNQDVCQKIHNTAKQSHDKTLLGFQCHSLP